MCRHRVNAVSDNTKQQNLIQAKTTKTSFVLAFFCDHTFLHLWELRIRFTRACNVFLLGGTQNGLNLAAKRGSNEMTASDWSILAENAI